VISLADLPVPDVLAELPLLLVAHVPQVLHLMAVIIMVTAFLGASLPAIPCLFFSPISGF
jgi:hypothetical protein